jgi:putative ABC transport system permease protein
LVCDPARLAEAAAIGTLGSIIGLTLGFGGHYFAVLGTQHVGGVPVTYRFEPTPTLAALGAVALTIAGAVPPAWRTGHLNIIDAIGYE